jgi:hypothetical protein
MDNTEEANMVGDLAYQFRLLDREIEKLKRDNDELKERMAAVSVPMRREKTDSIE